MQIYAAVSLLINNSYSLGCWWCGVHPDEYRGL